MTNILIIHGAYGHPGENWFPWLKKKLEKLGCKVFVPKFPTPEGQTLENWLNIFKEYKEYLNNDSIVIGHSLGTSFLLTLLENQSVKAAFFVAGFITAIGNPEFDSINKTFCRDFDWEKIKTNCKEFYIYHSDNDPYIPLEKANELAEHLGIEIILVKDAGHFNEKAGYTKFELLLGKIKEIIQSS